LERTVQDHDKASLGPAVDDAVERALADEATAAGINPSRMIASRSRAVCQRGERFGLERLFHLLDPTIGLEALVGEIVGVGEQQGPAAAQPPPQQEQR
jgi:hypothetical protein